MAKGKRKQVTVKTVAVGFGGTGKTCLLITYTTGEFPSEYIPLVFDDYPTSGEFDGKPYVLVLWDTAGGEDYERLRPLSYPQTDVLILLFDISDNDDHRFEQIHSYWWVELNHHCPDVPIILVGSKVDLRDQEGTETITTQEGQAMAEKIGAAKYMEISSLENRGVTELFKEVIILGFGHSSPEDKKKKKCAIL